MPMYNGVNYNEKALNDLRAEERRASEEAAKKASMLTYTANPDKYINETYFRPDSSKVGGFSPKDAAFQAHGVSEDSPADAYSSVYYNPAVPDMKKIDLEQSLRGVVESGRSQQMGLLDSLGKSRNLYDSVDSKGLAAIMGAQQENQARQNARDTVTKANQYNAQRGIGNSSMGLRSALGANRQMATDISSIRANQPMNALNIEGQRLGGLNQVNSGLSSIMGSPGQQASIMMGAQQVQRQSAGSPGVLPMLAGGAGAVIGGLAGGPAGAAAGYTVGSGVGGYLGSR